MDQPFFVLVDGEFIHARLTYSDSTIGNLVVDIRSSADLPSLKSYLRCKYYILKKPLEVDDENLPDVLSIMASLHDETKYQKVTHMKFVRNISKEFLPDHLYLVIDGELAQAAARVKERHGDLYRCLDIRVEAAKRWTLNDVHSNGGIFVDSRTKPPEMVDLERRLCSKRSFNNPNDDQRLSMARSFEPQFESSYIVNTLPADQATVKNNNEFLLFFVLLSYYLPDAARVKSGPASSLKAHVFKSNFILPAFFAGRDFTDDLEYHEEMPWKFPLFVSCPAMSNVPQKYTPLSNFSVWFWQLALPLIIAEVATELDEKNRQNRMLLQGIALARLAFNLRRPTSTTTKSSGPFIVAIYLTKDLRAERYIMMKNESASNDKVHISRKDFDLTNIDDATAFQREMHNLASELAWVIEQLDSGKRDMLLAIKNEASGMMSLHSSDAWNKPTPAQTLDTIAEHQAESGPQNEDDLGVFGDDDVRSVLKQMNYEVAYVAFGHPNMAPIARRTDGQMVGCLKFVKDGRKTEEIEVLQYLEGLPDEFNHTVRPMRIWTITSGTIIAMPAAGNHITSLTDPDTHLWSLMKQLFEAVKFMHDHNVAHLDLKPSNILVPSEYGRLTIIDFGVSVRLRNAAELLQGRAGTEGYIAPEVDGSTKFSPIRADLWSTGKVVQELCLLCRPSRSRDALLALSKRLLDDDPRKRPMMSEVLQWMLDYNTATTPDSGPMSSLAPMSSGLAAVGA